MHSKPEPKTPKNLATKAESANVPVTTHYTREVYSRMLKMKKDRGFMNVQELTRIAIASFLEQNGYTINNNS